EHRPRLLHVAKGAALAAIGKRGRVEGESASPPEAERHRPREHRLATALHQLLLEGVDLPAREQLLHHGDRHGVLARGRRQGRGVISRGGRSWCSSTSSGTFQWPREGTSGGPTPPRGTGPNSRFTAASVAAGSTGPTITTCALLGL